MWMDMKNVTVFNQHKAARFNNVTVKKSYRLLEIYNLMTDQRWKCDVCFLFDLKHYESFPEIVKFQFKGIAQKKKNRKQAN